MRHDLEIIVHGRFKLLPGDLGQILAYTRTLGDEQLVVVGNFGSEEHTVELDDAGDWSKEEFLIEKYPASADGEGFTLRPWESRVYYRK